MLQHFPKLRTGIKMKTMNAMLRPLTAAILPFLLLFLLDVPALAQERQDGKGRIENARWEVAGDVVVITYDLIGDSNLAYDVQVTLTRESNKSFKLVPRAVTGSVGRGKFAGTRMEIRWNYKQDVPQGLEGEDYAFEFVINIVREEGSSNLLYYLGGGALAAGAAAAVLLGGGKKAAATPTPTGLPSPPAERPPSQ